MTTAEINKRVTVQLLTYPGCAFCGNAERLLEKVKSHMEWVEVQKVNIADHPELVERHGLMTTPGIVINGKLEFNRTPDEKTLVDRLRKAKQMAEGTNVSNVTFRVDNLHCEGCRISLEIGLKLRHGVLNATVNRQEGLAEVWFDNTETSWRKIGSQMKWYGYRVKKLPAA